MGFQLSNGIHTVSKLDHLNDHSEPAQNSNEEQAQKRSSNLLRDTQLVNGRGRQGHCDSGAWLIHVTFPPYPTVYFHSEDKGQPAYFYCSHELVQVAKISLNLPSVSVVLPSK